MGLLYPFPVSIDETDFVEVERNQSHQLVSLTVKSYGLPYLFWGYAIASILMIIILMLAVHASVTKLMTLGDDVDYILGLSLLAFGYSLPIFILAFFFYEKRIQRTTTQLIITHRFFYLTILTQKLNFNDEVQLIILSHLDSPNVARLKKQPESSSFENKGYFILYYQQADKKIFLDRHSRKADLEKLKNLLLFKIDNKDQLT